MEAGKWSLPGGFLGRDETAAGGIVREVKEETGWDCEAVSFFRINTSPLRPHEDRQNVAIEFLLRPIKETGSQDSENSKVEWIPIEQLLSFDQFAFDHGESIRLYLEYKHNNFPLPLWSNIIVTMFRNIVTKKKSLCFIFRDMLPTL